MERRATFGRYGQPQAFGVATERLSEPFCREPRAHQLVLTTAGFTA